MQATYSGRRELGVSGNKFKFRAPGEDFRGPAQRWRTTFETRPLNSATGPPGFWQLSVWFRRASVCHFREVTPGTPAPKRRKKSSSRSGHFRVALPLPKMAASRLRPGLLRLLSTLRSANSSTARLNRGGAAWDPACLRPAVQLGGVLWGQRR